MHDAETLIEVEEQTCVEGLDFYFEDGLMVLTRRYLLNRGFCCENRCRALERASQQLRSLRPGAESACATTCRGVSVRKAQ